MIKQLIKSFLKSRGRVIKSYNPSQERLREVKNNWLEKLNIQTIIDVGARTGGYASKARALFPNAHIYSIEALEEPFRELVSRFSDDKRFKAFNIGVSNMEGTVSFFLCDDNPGSSSLLKMEALHKEAYPFAKENTEIQINVTTMDKLFRNEVMADNLLIKLDVQGAELMVLEGAKNLLERAKLVYSEISFNQLYEDAASLEDLQSYLKKYGFVVRGIENVSRSLVDGIFLQADVFFVKN